MTPAEKKASELAEEYECDLAECANGCGELVLDGGFCSTKCVAEYDDDEND